ncbi:hypothetical protein B0E38_05243 [Streptomyces sp. 111WW2]|nr:hypothetical protein B0E38_05243 [Streptomyces sp. 111WW2]
MDDPVQHGGGRSVAVQGLAQRRERGRLPEREDVGGRRDGARGGLLGGHVLGRADGGAGGGVRGAVGGERDAEVDDARSVGGQQDVGRFEVPVHDPRRVDGLKGLGDPRHQPEHGGHRQRPAPGDGARQGGPRHVQGGQPGRGAVRVGVDQFGGVGALHSAGCRDLPAETPPEGRVVGQFRPYDLDGHGPAAPGVRQVHPAHAARSEPGRQTVTGHRARIVALQGLEDLGRVIHRFPPHDPDELTRYAAYAVRPSPGAGGGTLPRGPAVTRPSVRRTRRRPAR